MEGKLWHGPFNRINKYRASPPRSKTQCSHSKELIDTNNKDTSKLTSPMLTKFENCVLAIHSSTGHRQPNVNWQSHIKDNPFIP